MPEENCKHCGYPGNGEDLVKTSAMGMYNCCKEELMEKLVAICAAGGIDFDEYSKPFEALFDAAQALKKGGAR